MDRQRIAVYDCGLDGAFPDLAVVDQAHSGDHGFSGARLLLVDEASRVDEDLYLAMLPVFSVSGGDVWLISTPFGRRGFFYQTWVEGGANWHRVKVPATQCPRIRPENLERDRKTMGDRWFRQEYLCEFADNQEQLFPEELVRKTIRYDIQPLFPNN